MNTTIERLAIRLKNTGEDVKGSAILERLVSALDGAEPSFHTNELYQLNGADFELALALLRDWRFRSHISADVGLRTIISELTPPHGRRLRDKYSPQAV